MRTGAIPRALLAVQSDLGARGAPQRRVMIWSLSTSPNAARNSQDRQIAGFGDVARRQQGIHGPGGRRAARNSGSPSCVHHLVSGSEVVGAATMAP